MNTILPALLLVVTLTLCGCAGTKNQTSAHQQPVAYQSAGSTKKESMAPKQSAQPIMTQDDSLSAKVISVETVARFVVLDFPDGRVPKLNQHLFLYRAGLKTAEVKVVGPQQDTSIVADIVSGEAETGDTVRDE